MSKEKQIREYESKQLIDELSKMPPMVIATAYLHAINYTLYGVDVTEKWLTATQNTSALEKAYQKGYYDAMKYKEDTEQPEWNNHTVACMLAELFDDTCACNYNGIDEWLPSKCELLDSCPNPVGVACWEQYLKHRAERRTDE